MRESQLLLMAVLAGAGCGQGGGGGGGSDRPDLSFPEDLATLPDLEVARSGVGAPCTGTAFTQGTCNDGLVCLPDNPQLGTTDGYCTRHCDAGKECPADAACVSDNGFSMCMLSCQSDADCRTPNYACRASGGGKVCAPEGGGGGVVPGTNDGGACVTPIVRPGSVDGGIFGRNVQISGGPGTLEAECQIAVDPHNENIVVAWNALLARTGGIGVIHSGSDGTSWDAEAQSLPSDQTVDKNSAHSDPVVAVDSQGNFYVSWVGFDRSEQDPGPSNMHIVVAKSTTGGAVFTEVQQISPPDEWTQGGFLDKPWIHVSPVNDTIYVTWDRLTSPTSPVDIRMTHSSDGGKTWGGTTPGSPPISINDPGKRLGIDRNLAQIDSGDDGAPVVVWVEVQQEFGSTANQVYVQRFNPDATKLGGNVLVTHPPDSPVFEDPSIAVYRDQVYVGFISGNSKGVWDVRVAASLDGGATFLPSVKVNDDASCATHFHHQIAVDGKGNLHAIWFDNRYLQGNVFWAMSAPADQMNPLAFGQNQFVNDVPFTFTTRRDRANWLGDYLGLWIGGGEIYAAWTDNRTTNRSHIYFAKGAAP